MPKERKATTSNDLKKKTVHTTSLEGAREPLSVAREEFEKYRTEMHRMYPNGAPRTYTAPDRSTSGPLREPVFAVPFPHDSHSPYGPEMHLSTHHMKGSMFKSIGKMMHFGVEFLNSVLAGGIQVMEGFTTGDSCHDYNHSCNCHSPEGYQHMSCCDCYYSCSCHTNDACHSSVNGCF